MFSRLVEAVSWITNKARETLQEAKELARWVWEVLQGDFKQDQDVSHIAANVGISIGVTATGIGVVVAWLMDLRDLIANSIHIYRAAKGEGEGAAALAAGTGEAGSEAVPMSAGLNFGRVPVMLWIALIATLIGAVPAVGDLLKGVFRIVMIFFKRAARAMPGVPVAKIMSKAIGDAMPAIRELMGHPMVVKFMNGLGWHRPFHELAKAFREMKSLVIHKKIMAQFDEFVGKFHEIINEVRRWLPRGAEEKVKALDKLLNDIRAALDAAVARLIHPFQDCLDAIIHRLELEDLAAFGTRTGQYGTHYYGQIQKGSRAWQEVRHEPYLVKVPNNVDPPFTPTSYADNQRVIDGAWTDPHPWPAIPQKDFETFHTVKPDTLSYKPGEEPIRLYRVVDPGSRVDGKFWMTEVDFKELTSRADWRDACAVKHEWNANGQFVVYTLQPGEQLKVWRGPASSQHYDADLWYRGGTEQIVFLPDPARVAQISPRQSTGWGYVDNYTQLADNKVMIDLFHGTELKPALPPPTTPQTPPTP